MTSLQGFLNKPVSKKAFLMTYFLTKQIFTAYLLYNGCLFCKHCEKNNVLTQG